MTAEKIAEIRRQSANRGAVPCARCKASGLCELYEGPQWRLGTCPQCGGIANRAVGLLSELLDALDTALAGRAEHGTDAEQQVTRFIAEDETTTWQERAEKAERDLVLRQEYCDAAREQRDLIAGRRDKAIERAERAELNSRTATAKLHNYAIELGEALGQKQRLLEDIATLTRERDSLIDELESAKVLDAQARTDWEKLTCERDEANEFFDKVKAESDTFRVETERLTRELETCKEDRLSAEHEAAAFRTMDPYATVAMLTRELEAERAEHHAAMAALADTQGDVRKWFDRAGELEASAAKMREALEAYDIHSSKRTEYVRLRHKALSSTAGTEMLERLRKAETDRDKFASCWAKAETALSDMEIAKNERITTLEVALSTIATMLGIMTTQDSQQIVDNATIVIDAKNLHIVELEADLEEARKALEHIEDLAAHTDWAAASSHAHTAHERIGRTVKGD